MSEQLTGSLIALHGGANPVDVLCNDNLREKFLTELDAMADARVADLTTATGRKAVASFAFQFVRTKTAIKGAADLRKDELRAGISEITARYEEIAERLDKAAARARAPLTALETAEKARKAEEDRVRTFLSSAATIRAADNSETIADRIVAVREVPDSEVHAGLKASTLDALGAAYDRVCQEELDRVELERLRAEKAEREEALAVAAQLEEVFTAVALLPDEIVQDEEACGAPICDEKAEREAAVAVIAAAERELDKITQEESRGGVDDLARADESADDRDDRLIAIANATVALMTECGLSRAQADKVMAAIGGGCIPGVCFNFAGVAA